MKGRIVCSAAGRDRGEFMVIVGFCGKDPLVCNGKDRRIEKPKRKNAKHLKYTNAKLEPEQLNSNSSIRKNLKKYANENPTDMEENQCQNQI